MKTKFSTLAACGTAALFGASVTFFGAKRKISLEDRFVKDGKFNPKVDEDRGRAISKRPGEELTKFRPPYRGSRFR